MIDAFVAVGGNEDTSGKVDADKLIEIIKKEFELTIDIEGLIKEIDADGSGEIEFNEFFDLLKTDLSEGKDNYDLEWFIYIYLNVQSWIKLINLIIFPESKNYEIFSFSVLIINDFN